MKGLFPFGTRVYADTSVFGGVFDTEFSEASSIFFRIVKAGRFKLVTSPTLDDEILPAPLRIVSFYRKATSNSDVVNDPIEIEDLKNAYIKAGILTSNWESDALHVASVVVGKCKLIVSWNFKHIVHFEKIHLYNAVNVLGGYEEISIHTPSEVIESDGF